jgi:hypothetical protein
MTDASEIDELARICGEHLKQEELLLGEILPMLRALRDSFGTPRGQPLAEQQAKPVTQLIEMMTSKRERLRLRLAPWLGVEPRQVTLNMALNQLPAERRRPLDETSARVRGMIEELVKLSYWVSLHLRIHLDTFQRLICDVTNSGSGSGRYGPRGQAEAPAYRPLIEMRG